MTSSVPPRVRAYSGCVLLVDDNDDRRQMFTRALQAGGFDVLNACSELQVQRHLRRTRPDALVVDLQRCEADGLPILAHLRARQSLGDVPIVFLAGCQDDDFRARARRVGADWFGLRPLSMLALQSHVGELIRNGRPDVPDERLERTG